jgi:uncharacterized repeat protein (TIGR01451 family)
MRNVVSLSFSLMIVILLQSSRLFAQSPPYNPILNISSNNNQGVEYQTSGVSTGSANPDLQFYLFGDGYYRHVTTDPVYHFPPNNSGFSTQAFFAERYTDPEPTKRVVHTGPTVQSVHPNPGIILTSNPDIITSWLPVQNRFHYEAYMFMNNTTTVQSGCVNFYYNTSELELDANNVLIYNNWVTNQTIQNVFIPLKSGFNRYVDRKVTWQFTNLQPHEKRVIYLPLTAKSSEHQTFYVAGKVYFQNCITEDPPVMVNGDGGGNPSSMGNTFVVKEFKVHGQPHDPNSKRANPGCFENIENGSNVIEYTINFQNFGNAMAQNIRIEDIIDPDLDLQSVFIEKSSHACTFTTDPLTRKLTLFLNNAWLPGTNQNPAPRWDRTQGYVTFSIRIDNLDFEDCIANTASIYFDTQPAIVTNTAYFTRTCPTGDGNVPVNCGDIIPPADDRSRESQTGYLNEKVTIYPNPFEDRFSIFFDSFGNSPLVIELYNVEGKQLRKTEFIVAPEHHELTMNQENSGVYFIKVISDSKTSIHKIIKR